MNFWSALSDANRRNFSSVGNGIAVRDRDFVRSAALSFAGIMCTKPIDIVSGVPVADRLASLEAVDTNSS